MKQLPEGLTGQALALAVAPLGAGLFYLLIVSPVLGLYQERADLLDSRVATAQRYEALTRELPALKAADKQWRDRNGGELLLDGSSDALAAAALQSAVKGLVEDAGARLTSAEVLSPTADGAFRRVGLRVAFSGDLKLVTAVLRAVETSRPVLSVGDFSLHTGGAAGKAGDSEDDDSSAPEGGALAVTLDVYGYRAA